MQKYNIYELNGKHIGFYTPKDIETITQSELDVKRMKYALETEKGYGFYKGYFISNSFIHIMTRNELVDYFNNWVSRNYTNINKAISKYNNTVDLDVLHDIILYVSNKLLKSDEIYSFMYEITERYFSKLKDIKRDTVNVTLKHKKYESEVIRNGEIDDFVIDTSSVNSLHFVDIIKNVLINTFTQNDIDIYFDYMLNYNNKNGGLAALAQKNNITFKTLRNKISKIRGYLSKNKRTIHKVFEVNSYKNIDEYTILNIFE